MPAEIQTQDFDAAVQAMRGVPGPATGEPSIKAVAQAIADARPRWIPFMERLPEMRAGEMFTDDLLVTDGKHRAVARYDGYVSEWTLAESAGSEPLSFNPTAWQPLPPPPESAG